MILQSKIILKLQSIEILDYVGRWVKGEVMDFDLGDFMIWRTWTLSNYITQLYKAKFE